MLETAGLDSTVLDAGIAAQQLQLVNAIVDEDRQYATRLTITRTDNENASESVISTVISWLMKKRSYRKSTVILSEMALIRHLMVGMGQLNLNRERPPLHQSATVASRAVSCGRWNLTSRITG